MVELTGKLIENLVGEQCCESAVAKARLPCTVFTLISRTVTIFFEEAFDISSKINVCNVV